MKLVGLHFSQLTVSDRSADKQSVVALIFCLPPLLPFSPLSGERERSAMEVDASDLERIGVYMTTASVNRAGRTIVWYAMLF